MLLAAAVDAACAVAVVVAVVVDDHGAVRLVLVVAIVVALAAVVAVVVVLPAFVPHVFSTTGACKVPSFWQVLLKSSSPCLAWPWLDQKLGARQPKS